MNRRPEAIGFIIGADWAVRTMRLGLAKASADTAADPQIQRRIVAFSEIAETFHLILHEEAPGYADELFPPYPEPEPEEKKRDLDPYGVMKED